MLGLVPGAGVAPRPPGAGVGWPAGAPVGDDVDSGAVSPTARPCPVLARSSVLGMIRNAPSAARTTTTPAKTSLRWADVSSIAAALLPAPQRAQPERGRASRLGTTTTTAAAGGRWGRWRRRGPGRRGRG